MVRGRRVPCNLILVIPKIIAALRALPLLLLDLQREGWASLNICEKPKTLNTGFMWSRIKTSVKPAYMYTCIALSWMICFHCDFYLVQISCIWYYLTVLIFSKSLVYKNFMVTFSNYHLNIITSKTVEPSNWKRFRNWNHRQIRVINNRASLWH